MLEIDSAASTGVQCKLTYFMFLSWPVVNHFPSPSLTYKTTTVDADNDASTSLRKNPEERMAVLHSVGNLKSRN